MPKHLLNVVKDTFDERDYKLEVAHAAGTVPSAVSLLQWLGPVKDQKTLGSCTAHAGTGMREFLYRKYFNQEFNKAVAKATFCLSPLFLYAVEREIEGDFGQDNGAQSRTIYVALAKYGCALERQDPYDVNDVEVLPTAAELTDALPYQHITYHRVMTLQTLKAVLASGYCVTVGMPVFDDFESDDVAQTGKVPVPAAGAQSIGGHETLIYGYRDSDGMLLVRNSWGADWGIDGDYELPYAYFDAPGVVGQYDWWTATLAPVPTGTGDDPVYPQNYPPAPPTHEQIAVAAYYLYLNASSEYVSTFVSADWTEQDIADYFWFEAEKQLQSQ